MWDGFFRGVYGPEGCDEVNFITIFVRREEAAVKQQIVLFSEVDGEPQVSVVHKTLEYIVSEHPQGVRQWESPLH